MIAGSIFLPLLKKDNSQDREGKTEILLLPLTHPSPTDHLCLGLQLLVLPTLPSTAFADAPFRTLLSLSVCLDHCLWTGSLMQRKWFLLYHSCCF